jgi:hypothetical protein
MIMMIGPNGTPFTADRRRYDPIRVNCESDEITMIQKMLLINCEYKIITISRMGFSHGFKFPQFIKVTRNRWKG